MLLTDGSVRIDIIERVEVVIEGEGIVNEGIVAVIFLVIGVITGKNGLISVEGIGSLFKEREGSFMLIGLGL